MAKKNHPVFGEQLQWQDLDTSTNALEKYKTFKRSVAGEGV